MIDNVTQVTFLCKGKVIMNASLVEPINTKLETSATNMDSKIKSITNTAVELFSIIIMWGVVATFIGLLAFTWV
jgi:hypothetical protein